MIGVKEFINQFKPKIDWDKKAKDKAKELGVSKDDILKEWEESRQKGIEKGFKLEKQKQEEYNGLPNYVYHEYQKADESFLYNHENYIIEEGYIYDQKPFVHPKYDLIGIPDRVQVIDGCVYIDDFKSDKHIYKEGFVVKNGKFSMKMKMTNPISHLDLCNYNEYRLQLSLYMNLILSNNKTLRPGKLRILHTIFDEDTLLPEQEVIEEVAYLRKEVLTILNTLKKRV